MVTILTILNALLETFSLNKDEASSALVNKMLSDFSMMTDDSGLPNEFLPAMLDESLSKLLSCIRKEETPKTQAAINQFSIKPIELKTSFRIEEDKIEEILASVRKIESIKTAFGQARNKMVEFKLPPDVIMEFQKTLNSLSFLTRDIMQMLIKIKVTSPQMLLEKVKAMISNLARTCGKKVKIRVEGNTEAIERKKVEVLEAILIHVVRNCVDHGIEYPEERVKAGKPEDGSITIGIFDNNDCVTVTILDDGRGVDFRAVRQAAYSKGKISKEQMESMDDAKSSELLFLEGVSTSASVGRLSGRGVGLGSVLNDLKSIGGSISVTSQLGSGTRVALKLPHKGGKE